MKCKRNPAVEEITKRYEERIKALRMEKELRKYGTKIPGGYIMTIGQLQEFFRKTSKRR